MSELLNRFRPLLIALCFAIGVMTPFVYNLGSALADKLDPRKKTHDLDTKDEALAKEEAALLASLEDEERAANQAKTAAQEAEHASIDLRKVADSIVHSEEKEAAPIKVKTAPTLKQDQPADISQPAKPLVVKQAPEKKIIEQQVVRQVIMERDPQLQEEVTAMGNLFSQWQNEFEVKHQDVLKMQRDSTSQLEDRIHSLEDRIVSRTETSSDKVEELRREWAEEKQVLSASYGSLQNQYQQVDSVIAEKTKPFDEKIENISKDYAQTQTLLKEQQATIKAIRLAEGQLKQRIKTNEAGLGDSMREISSVKESVDRIEVNLAELSNQFIDSLKYRPFDVHQAPPEWSDHDYDWNTPGPKYTKLPQNAVMSDMPIVTITEESANLWSGPEEEDKIITTMRRGGQLAVEAVQFDWYRVILADGRRAWIPARSVIHNNPVGKDTTLRIASAN
jgi:hypothetical protein